MEEKPVQRLEQPAGQQTDTYQAALASLVAGGGFEPPTCGL